MGLWEIGCSGIKFRNSTVVTRFIGKIGLEVLTSRVLAVEGWEIDIIDNPQLDELRDHVRRGFPSAIWPMSYRRIYPAEKEFIDRLEVYQVLHEYDILLIEGDEYFIVVAIFGVEYALNLGGRSIEGYERWLKKNDGKSLLYYKEK